MVIRTFDETPVEGYPEAAVTHLTGTRRYGVPACESPMLQGDVMTSIRLSRINCEACKIIMKEEKL